MTMTQEKRTSIKDIILEENENLKLTLEFPEIEGAVIIAIAGFIDTFNSDFFRTQVTRIIESGYRHIIIDATATTFMSSTGIGAFTALLKYIRRNQGSLLIFGMPSKIYDVFRLLGFISFFDFCDTRKAALDKLKNSQSVSSKSEVFPFHFSCPACRRKLKASRKGKFRCPSCRIILSVDALGSVQPG